jgi:hypothetical protein
MKEGDYIIPKESFTRTIYNVTRKNNIVTNIIEVGIVNFSQNTKYKIIKIYTPHNNIQLIQTELESKTVSFSLTKTLEYEYVYDLFYLDNTVSLRSEKLKQLNKIAKINKFKNLFKF